MKGKRNFLIIGFFWEILTVSHKVTFATLLGF